GQNVNKVNTKAVLKWNVLASSCLPADVKTRFVDAYGSRLTREGVLVLSCDTHREQARNLSGCHDRLRALILAVAKPPRRRIKTKPSRSSVERRLGAKHRRSEKKDSRRFRGDE
ncbi:MAG: aminoacyl-tRNA hydrolase, partial [Planctomycetales bacterium]|nr:aminoacyl-tRNA hydrolase [Planctomycetales bacterium]